MAAAKGNKTRPGIKLGICGEHGGDPDSVKFCHRVGLTYVSCSPYRVPVARLAAAQAAIEEKRKTKTKLLKKKKALACWLLSSHIRKSRSGKPHGAAFLFGGDYIFVQGE